MQLSLPFFPQLTVHLYGLIIGVAVVIGANLTARMAKKHGLSDSYIDGNTLALLMSGILSARIWHVLTDFHYYKNNLMGIFAVWRGGLSIVGGIIGGLVGLYYWHLFSERDTAIGKSRSRSSTVNTQQNILLFLDSIPFGLPFAQAVGRLGNYVNHELYGLPTTVIWKLYIPPEFRLEQFSSQAYYHPLFAYEALLLVLFGVVLWWRESTGTVSVGKGRILLAYLLYYSFIRFFLDFLRIDTAVKIGGILGINQIVLLVIFCTTLIMWSSQGRKKLV